MRRGCAQKQWVFFFSFPVQVKSPTISMAQFERGQMHMVPRQQPNSGAIVCKIPLAALCCWRQISHTTDGTPTPQPAGWSCLTVKIPASHAESPIAPSQKEGEELMQNIAVFPPIYLFIYFVKLAVLLRRGSSPEAPG